jgi:hypothetical protein
MADMDIVGLDLTVQRCEIFAQFVVKYDRIEQAFLLKMIDEEAISRGRQSSYLSCLTLSCCLAGDFARMPVAAYRSHPYNISWLGDNEK